MQGKTKRAGQQGKRIEEVVAYAVSHRTRVHILIVLNEGTYTAAQIAEIIGVPLNNVANHIRELLDAGSIELARTEQTGNLMRHYYRAVEIPFYSREDAEAMTPEQRQVTAGLIVQSAAAEVMAALWAGKLTDPRTWLAWDWFNVDQRGREEIEEAQQQYWERVGEIETEATNRRIKSGEDAQSMLVTVFGYERAREARKFDRS